LSSGFQIRKSEKIRYQISKLRVSSLKFQFNAITLSQKSPSPGGRGEAGLVINDVYTLPGPSLRGGES
jgi:hypothetical protein